MLEIAGLTRITQEPLSQLSNETTEEYTLFLQYTHGVLNLETVKGLDGSESIEMNLEPYKDVATRNFWEKRKTILSNKSEIERVRTLKDEAIQEYLEWDDWLKTKVDRIKEFADSTEVILQQKIEQGGNVTTALKNHTAVLRFLYEVNTDRIGVKVKNG